MGSAKQGRSGDLMSLKEIARQLGNDKINRVVAAFGEQRVSMIRVLVLSLVLLWVAFWLNGPQPVLVKDAHAVFPWAIAAFIYGCIWAVIVRAKIVKSDKVADVVGMVSNFVIVAVLTNYAFLLLITLEAVLPFLSIMVAAQYSKRWFYVSVVTALIILLLSAPDGYWLSRPAYLVYALVLTVGLPLLISGMLNALREVSVQAIFSRDAQSRFVSTMSHELRTPLNTLVNAAVLIDQNQLTGEQRRLMEAVSSNATALLHRVNDVLDVAGIDGGRLRLINEPFGLSNVFQTVSDIFAPQALAKQVDFQIQGAEKVPEVLLGDAGRIEQVLSNLTANALKYTPSGGAVTIIAMKASSAEAGKVSLVLAVADTGIGIAEEDKPRIFDAFHQISAGASRSHGGVGLGLYIVRTISDQIGGTLSVENNPGGGTIFTWRFALPLAAPGETVAKQLPVLEALERHRNRVPSMRCLIFEDTVSNRYIISRLMTLAGHAVIFADDGVDATTAMKDANADVILLDLHMPVRSGWDVLEELQNSVGLDNAPPVVVISADANASAATTSLQLGAAAFVTKPISPYKLLDVLEGLSKRIRN